MTCARTMSARRRTTYMSSFIPFARMRSTKRARSNAPLAPLNAGSRRMSARTVTSDTSSRISRAASAMVASETILPMICAEMPVLSASSLLKGRFIRRDSCCSSI